MHSPGQARQVCKLKLRCTVKIRVLCVKASILKPVCF
uniref:Uncharacterized protein n=1 Tax=Anguilla anguilla TaxID=7936 RepID=A0A0E9SGU6_ANGAN